MSINNIALPVLSGEFTFARYMSEINKFPYLTEQEEYDLAVKWTEENDLSAAHKLVTSHLRLVAKIALSFRGYGLPLLELISEGNIGLMQAVKKFDPSKGFRLATYAMWWIKAQIQEYVLHSWSLVKIGTTTAQKKLFFNLRKLKNRLKKMDDAGLTPNEVAMIANELQVSEKDVVEMNQRLNNSDQSLNDPILGYDGEKVEHLDFIAEEADNHETIMIESNELQHKKAMLANAIDHLNERERQIIYKRRLTEPQATLEDLSQEYGISRERIRQIETRAMEKLQQLVQTES